MLTHAGSPDRKRKREESQEPAAGEQQQDSQPGNGQESPKQIKQEEQQQEQPKAAGPPGLGMASKAGPPGLANPGSPPGLPPKVPAAAGAAAKKGGPTAAELAAGQDGQLGRVKQEVKHEGRMSRNNSDLTLGINADQEANVGLQSLRIAFVELLVDSLLLFASCWASVSASVCVHAASLLYSCSKRTYVLVVPVVGHALLFACVHDAVHVGCAQQEHCRSHGRGRTCCTARV